MRTVRTKVYQFSELSEQAKQKAVENLYEINIDFEWWEGVYDDANEIGLKITSFDIDRGSYCNGEFTKDASYTANKIKSDHGEDCETYKTAVSFLSDYDNLVEKYSDGINKNIVSEENEYDFDKEADELEADFLKSLCEDYRIILKQEYEHLTSREGIIETIEANEYEFTKDGERFYK